MAALFSGLVFFFFCIGHVCATQNPADGDLAVYGECSSVIKPNVLFLFDTSISMRKQDVIDHKIPDYDHYITYKTDNNYKLPENGQWKYKYNERDRIYMTDAGIVEFYPYNGLYDNYTFLRHIACENVKNGLIKDGYYKDGQLKIEDYWVGAKVYYKHVCQGGGLKIDYATGNYLNYLVYVDWKMDSYSFNETEYDPSVNYRNFHGTDLGYGDYRTDIVYVDMAGIRPFNSVFHPGGIKLNEMECADATASLRSKGWVKRRVWELANSGCSEWFAPKYMLMTGNFLNYLDMKRSRRYNGIDALWDVIKSRESDVRFGLMQFDLGKAKILGENIYVGNHTAWASQGGDLSFPCGAPLSMVKNKLYGRYIRGTTDIEYGQPLAFGYEGFWFDDWGKQTPLAESLVEAGLYFSGQKSWFNTYTIPEQFYKNNLYDTDHTIVSSSNGSYRSPIQCATQDNHIIIITDGKPYDDFDLLDNSKNYFGPNHPFEFSYRWIEEKVFPRYVESLSAFCDSGSDCKIGDTDSDGDTLISQSWLDDVAKYLHDNDFSSLPDKQNITTHAISFRIPSTESSFNPGFLKDTATNGGGKYAVARDKKDLVDKINQILMGSVISTSYSNAVTPVRQDDLVYSGDHTFLTFFKIKKGERDRGNIKKFKREKNQLLGVGDVQYVSSAQSPVKDLWSGPVPQGVTDVPVDGVAYVLWKQLNDIATETDGKTMAEKLVAVRNTTGTNPGRKIYTAHNNTMGLLPDLVLGDNPAVKVMRFPDLNEYYNKTDIVPFLVNTVYALGEKWPLGDIVHSNVVVAQYPKSYAQEYEVDSYLIVGANDGMLHCFDMVSGREMWAFIPPDLINDLHKLEQDKSLHSWFVDGGVAIYNESVDYKNGLKVGKGEGEYKVRFPSKLIFGERRGGTSYHVLDISDINNPGYERAIGGAGIWGQSWSKPALCQIKKSTGNAITDKTMGFVVAGGYDENQNWDNYAPAQGSDTRGKFINVYRMDGTLQATLNQSIDACITSARIIDHDHDSQRIFSRIYAGDLEGNVYHFSDDVREVTTTEGGVSKVSWVEKEYTDMDGGWQARHKLFQGHRYNVSDPSRPGQEVEISQKIFYAPVMGYSCDGNMVFFGTGNRENPEDINEKNSIYAVKEDTWNGDPYDRSDINVYTMKDEGLGGANGANLYSLIPPDNDDLLSPSQSKGWAINFPSSQRDGEKVISDVIVLDDVMIFGTYTPKSGNSNVANPTDPCNPDPNCKAGHGRIYVVNTCSAALNVKSYETGTADPMPQPAIVFDSDTGKVLIATGNGELIDPEIPVVVLDYWKHSGSGK